MSRHLRQQQTLLAVAALKAHIGTGCGLQIMLAIASAMVYFYMQGRICGHYLFTSQKTRITIMVMEDTTAKYFKYVDHHLKNKSYRPEYLVASFISRLLFSSVEVIGLDRLIRQRRLRPGRAQKRSTFI